MAQHDGKLLTCHHSVVHTLLVGCNLSLQEVKLGPSDLNKDITLIHLAGYLAIMFISQRLCVRVIKKRDL